MLRGHKLWGLTATIALLAGMSGAHAQGAPGAGSFPGSFLVPGTQTSFRVGGYVKLDYTYDFGPTQNIRGGIDFSSIPLDATKNSILGSVPADATHHIHGDSQFTASQSRFNIETRTPTVYGEMKTFIEGDFTNPNGLTNSGSFKLFSDSSGFRLRHAYGTLGPFLAGQTWTLFMDLDASVETLDFGGPPTVFLRQPQVRYTFDFGNGLTFQASAENPQSEFTDSKTGSTTSTFGSTPKQGDKIPDFIARGNYNAPWGHLSVAGVFRDLYDHNGTTLSVSEFGWGAMLGASLNMGTLAPWFGKDQLTVEAKGGDGIGRFNNSDDPFAEAVVKKSTNTLKTISSYGGAVGYTHFWTDTLRSNATGGYVRAEYPRGIFSPAALESQEDRIYTAHVNLIWSPVPQTNFGIEYIYAKRRLVDGQSGELNRMQLSAQFRF
jgi:hypothetical protein